MNKDQAGFTGHGRKKQTRWTVRTSDFLSKWIITVGGIGTVVAISSVLLLLLWVAFPLLMPAKTASGPELDPVTPRKKPILTSVDEYQLIGWSLYPDGKLVSFRLDNGDVLDRVTLYDEKSITATSFAVGSREGIFGFSDGSFAFGTIDFETDFVDQDQAPDLIKLLGKGETARLGNAIVQRISPTQFRIQSLRVDLQDPIIPDIPSPIYLVDDIVSGDDRISVLLHENGEPNLIRVTTTQNLLTGERTLETESTALPFDVQTFGGLPNHIALSGLGDWIILIAGDGRAIRYNVRDFNNPSVSEEIDLLEDPQLKVTAATWLLGRTTLLIGDSSGQVSAWFPARTEDGTGEPRLVQAHRFAGPDSPVTALASSSRMRMAGIGYGDGSIQLRHVTSHKILGQLNSVPEGYPVSGIVFSPKDDGVMAVTERGLTRWDIDTKHPETTFRSLFLPTWYEGAAGPEHVWQSSAATDDFESKFGLMPVVFGTIKATVYSLIFGVPIALLAAIFTSEFLSSKVRVRVKPVVELMASLPSVVLGFLAALVFAPVVAGRVALFLVLFITVPFSFLTGAYLWQLLPHRFSLRIQRWRFPFMFFLVPVGYWLGHITAPVIERFCFGGDIILWLDGQVEGTVGVWAFTLFPVALLALAVLFGTRLSPWLRSISADWTRTRCALFDLGKFLAGIILAAGLAILTGILLNAIGLDPRGSVFGTYVQRNSLVVGFVMGFAIIPIIYTLSEDALSAVPEHLRSASLGAGATQWQTAVRIIIPTAMSGLFSAVMIGLGRAVGETMIVLMAAGNTPIMDWNIFNGFRTLSANIAVELPEAVRNSTHYRTLFLAALVLFLMTFVLNTVAEIVRLRFRKRASEL